MIVATGTNISTAPPNIPVKICAVVVPNISFLKITLYCAGNEKAKRINLVIKLPALPTTNINECIKMADLSNRHDNKLILICHVLRHTEFFNKIKEIVKNKRIGRIIGIQLNENVGIFLSTISYVRGPWNNSDKTTFMLLAKSCHDLDIITWLADSKIIKITDFLSGCTEQIKVGENNSSHNGGDHGIIEYFLDCIRNNKTNKDLNSMESTLESHLIAFAAQEAMVEEKVVFMDEFR